MSDTLFSSTLPQPTRRQFGQVVAGVALGALAVPTIVRRPQS